MRMCGNLTTNLSCTGIASLIIVSFFLITGPILLSKNSKSVADILQKFSNLPDGSRLRSSMRFVALYLSKY